MKYYKAKYTNTIFRKYNKQWQIFSMVKEGWVNVGEGYMKDYHRFLYKISKKDAFLEMI